jgi:hypothetical protein
MEAKLFFSRLAILGPNIQTSAAERSYRLPLRACSEISSRHFVQAFFVRRFMAQHCYTLATPRKMWFVNRSHDYGRKLF